MGQLANSVQDLSRISNNTSIINSDNGFASILVSWFWWLHCDYVWKWASLVAQTVKNACNSGDPGSTSGLGRSPGEGNGNPLQFSCLETSMDREAWQVMQSLALPKVRHDWVTSTPCMKISLVLGNTTEAFKGKVTFCLKLTFKCFRR